MKLTEKNFSPLIETLWMRLGVLLPLILLGVFSDTASAQGIRGRVLDAEGGPVPFVNVLLLQQKDSFRVAASLSDSAGWFRLDAPRAGTYYLRLTGIGFEEYASDTFGLKEPSLSIDLGLVRLKRDAKSLQEVTLTALRPQITQLADRMVVSVEGTVMAAGSTAYAVLAKAPGVFIDAEGNIQLNGRSGVNVLINNKPTYLSAKDLRTLLEGMSAENLKNIEIITNASAKYDAEGTAGILNLNLKKNTLQGINGSVYSGGSYNFKQFGASAGGSVNFKTGPWNAFLNADFVRRVGGREATFTRIFYGPSKTTYFDQNATGNFVVQGPPALRGGADYTISERHSIGFMTNFTINTAHSDFLTDTYIGTHADQPAQYIDADNFSKNTYRNFTANLHYTGSFDTAGTQLSADVDYVRITNVGEADFFNSFRDLIQLKDSQDVLYTNTPNGYDIYSGKVDLTKPFKKEHKLEAGLKFSRVVSDNDFRFYFNNDVLKPDPLRTNLFYYTENIAAAYLTWHGRISKALQVQTGIRAEQTRSAGKSSTGGDPTRRTYFNLFPSIFIQQKITDNYGINYSYSRRITRPNYGNLNPFRFYRDPYTWIEGNPYLRPQYTHSFSIAQSFKKVYNLTASYQFHRSNTSKAHAV